MKSLVLSIFAWGVAGALTLLISTNVKDLVSQDDKLDFDEHGAIELRGRMEKVEIYGVTLAD
jgi:hypothetical protein